MIYVDSSVVLADLLAEQRSPPEALWEDQLGSSRLLTYEVWNRIHAYGLMTSHGRRARGLLARINLTEMSEPALARAFEPFPLAVRTLDALHLATMDFLRRQGESVELASYDHRLLATAQALDIPLAEL
ncbi:MAG TPA: PIN domain-containing protein [Stellaceae bacterium]